jgi:hypothetical protein
MRDRWQEERGDGQEEHGAEQGSDAAPRVGTRIGEGSLHVAFEAGFIGGDFKRRRRRIDKAAVAMAADFACGFRAGRQRSPVR